MHLTGTNGIFDCRREKETLYESMEPNVCQPSPYKRKMDTVDDIIMSRSLRRTSITALPFVTILCHLRHS